MIINKKTARLICNIENIIADNCYNPNAYDGYTGEQGKHFRYPVHILPDKDSPEPVRIRGNINDDYLFNEYYNGKLNKKSIESMYYAFGSNKLFIGSRIIEVLEYLETRYGIDFNELEGSITNK